MRWAQYEIYALTGEIVTRLARAREQRAHEAASRGLGVVETELGSPFVLLELGAAPGLLGLTTGRTPTFFESTAYAGGIRG